MFDILTIASVVAGFAFFVVLSAWLGGGSSLADMLASPTMPARPRGVEESDLPRFVFPESRPVNTSTAQANAVIGRVYGTGAA